MTPYVARESFIGRLVGECVDVDIPRAPAVPDEAIDFRGFEDMEDDGE